MTHSNLANGVQLTSDSSPRSGGIDRFIVHHAATTSLAAILSLFQPGGRTVSANYALGSDGTLILAVDEDRRAWTSSSAEWDGRAVTIEVANSYAGEPWPVSDAAFDKLARLIADVSIRYGFPINDDTILTHQELYRRYGASYATACPGDMQRRKSELLALANRYRVGGGATPTEKEEDMPKAKLFRSDTDRGGNGDMRIVNMETGLDHGISDPNDLDLYIRLGWFDGVTSRDPINVMPHEMIRIRLIASQARGNAVDAAEVARELSGTVTAAVEAALADIEFDGDAAAIAAKVDEILADDFARIPKAVTDEIGS